MHSILRYLLLLLVLLFFYDYCWCCCCFYKFVYYMQCIMYASLSVCAFLFNKFPSFRNRFRYLSYYSRYRQPYVDLTNSQRVYNVDAIRRGRENASRIQNMFCLQDPYNIACDGIQKRIEDKIKYTAIDMKEYISTKKKNTLTQTQAHNAFTYAWKIKKTIKKKKQEDDKHPTTTIKIWKKKNLNQKKYTAGKLRSYLMVRHEFVVKLHLTHKISKPMTLVLIIPSCFCQQNKMVLMKHLRYIRLWSVHTAQCTPFNAFQSFCSIYWLAHYDRCKMQDISMCVCICYWRSCEIAE